MNQEKNQLFEDFNKESLLYMDGDLSKSRMEFWDQKLNEFPELNNILEEYKSISNRFNNQNFDLSNEKFDFMIDKTISKKTVKTKIETIINNLFSSNIDYAFGKISFASILIIGAIVVSVLSDRPSPVIKITENISSEILEWDAEFVDSQISKVSNLLRVTEDEEYRKYYRYKKTSSNVDKNLNQINNSIEKLKDKINNKKL